MTRSMPCTQTFGRLLRRLTSAAPPLPDPPAPADAVPVLITSFLMWESTTARASAAWRRISEHVVDLNDLRVCMPQEIVELVGERYPASLERAQRLRATLRHIYKREHEIKLDRLQSMGKREIRQYVRSLDGIPPYAADRVTLLCFDTHCVPVDDRLRRCLAREGVCDEDADINELATWVSRQVKSTEARAAHLALQGWVDRVGGRSSARRRTPAPGQS